MKFIRYNFWKLRQALNPRAQFKRALWQRLSVAWDERPLPAMVWYQAAWFRFGTAALVGLVAVGSFGTGAYAYVSPEVTEGSPLYPLKRVLEQVEEKLQRTPGAQARFYLKQLERREAEAAVLERRGEDRREWLEAKAVYLEERLTRVSNRLDSQSAPEVVRRAVRERLERKQLKLERRLERLNEQPERLLKRIERASSEAAALKAEELLKPSVRPMERRRQKNSAYKNEPAQENLLLPSAAPEVEPVVEPRPARRQSKLENNQDRVREFVTSSLPEAAGVQTSPDDKRSAGYEKLKPTAGGDRR